MSGFFRNDGTWVRREQGAPEGTQQQAIEAVRLSLDRVEHNESTAEAELKQLITKYPLLRHELKDKNGKHPLSPLVSYYTDEVLGVERRDSRWNNRLTLQR
jgi:hypothetical protein